MKLFGTVIFTLTIGLAACGQAPKGVGFTGIGSEQGTLSATQDPLVSPSSYRVSSTETVAVRTTSEGQRIETYTYGTPSVTKQASSAQISIPRGDVPVFYGATSVKDIGSRSGSILIAGRSAASFGSSRWGEKYTVPISFSDAQARLKVVVVAGMPFGVVGKIKRPFFSAGPLSKTFGEDAIRAVTQRTGCRYGGKIVTRSQQGAVERYAVLLSC